MAGPLAIDWEWRAIDLRLRLPWRIARGVDTVKRNVLVRLTCDGIEGLGEAAPNARYGEDAATVESALRRLRPLLGGDPARPGDILDRIQAAAPEDRAARAALDIALHDWNARREGVPLWRRLGTDPRTTPSTSMSIAIDEPKVMQEAARAAAGFSFLKIKLGTDRDREIVSAIREVTDLPLYVDANEGWTDVRQAAETILWMQGMGVILVEQPLPAADRDGAARLRERVELPIFADEAVVDLDDIAPLAGICDGINVKLQKAGGLRGAVRMIERARSCGLKVLIGCMVETSVGIAAAAHLSPLADHADLDGHLLIANDPFAGLDLVGGRLVPPDRPGLGVGGPWPPPAPENSTGR